MTGWEDLEAILDALLARVGSADEGATPKLLEELSGSEDSTPATDAEAGPRSWYWADGLLSQLLGERLSNAADARNGFQAAKKDALWVLADGLADGTHRSRLEGLEWLQSQLGDPKLPHLPVRVVGWLPGEQLGKFDYLAKPNASVEYLRLPALLPDLLKPAPTPEANRRWLLALEASERSLEVSFSEQRHRFKGLIAAVRIYLGALAVNHALSKNAEDTLAILAERAGDVQITSGLTQKLRTHHAFLTVPRQDRGDAQPPKQYRLPRPGIELAMIDDQHKDWDLVLEEVTDKKPLCFPNGGNDALNKVLTRDLLLLDCNLGQCHPTGIELLPALRSRSLDLPIVFMTGYDDAQLAIAALQAGANAFYAKELEDRADRASVDYYVRFCDLLHRPKREKELRKLWQQFLKRGEPMTPVSGTNAYADILEAAMRLSFYLLFSWNDDIRWWQWGLGADPTMGEQAVCRTVILLLDVAWPDGPAAWRATMSAVRGARHGGKTDWTDCNSIVTSVLRRCQEGTRSATSLAPTMPVCCPYTREQLTVEQGPWGIDGPIDKHPALSSRGVKELQTGLKGAPGPTQEFYADLLILDDEENWRDALRKAFPNATVGSSLADLKGKDLDTLNAVLLDWRIPEAAHGKAMLEYIKGRDPFLPVIVLSAATDTLAAIHSLKRGAAAFVSKAVPRERTSDECMSFVVQLRKTVRVAQCVGGSYLRERWWQLRALRERLGKLATSETLEQVWHQMQTALQFGKGKRVSLVKPQDLRDRIDRLCRLTLVVCHALELRAVAEAAGEVEAFPLALPDKWRWDALTEGQALPWDKLVTRLACGAAEIMARYRWCVCNGQTMAWRAWGAAAPPQIEIAGAMTHLSPKAKKLWDARNRQSPLDRECAVKCLLGAGRALCEFLENLPKPPTGQAARRPGHHSRKPTKPGKARR